MNQILLPSPLMTRRGSAGTPLAFAISLYKKIIKDYNRGEPSWEACVRDVEIPILAASFSRRYPRVKLSAVRPIFYALIPVMVGGPYASDPYGIIQN
ncbi:MAG: hypothetical protein LBL46_00530 [Rickettsiales bacterium]|jgi:hypothetical protein|nr:hypothetical protein [Rickettsiales bacterium]